MVELPQIVVIIRIAIPFYSAAETDDSHKDEEKRIEIYSAEHKIKLNKAFHLATT